MRIVSRMQKNPGKRNENLARTLDVSEKNGMEVVLTLNKGEWDSLASKMVHRFKETGHLMFRSISVSSRGILKKKRVNIP